MLYPYEVLLKYPPPRPHRHTHTHIKQQGNTQIDIVKEIKVGLIVDEVKKFENLKMDDNYRTLNPHGVLTNF